MGYRSEVAIALAEPAATLVRTLCEHDKNLRVFIRDDSDELIGFDSSQDSFDVLKVYWSYIKWYEGYLDVNTMETILSNIDEDDYLFIRIGEDTSDIEERGGFYDSDMYISRAISL